MKIAIDAGMQIKKTTDGQVPQASYKVHTTPVLYFKSSESLP